MKERNAARRTGLGLPVLAATILVLCLYAWVAQPRASAQFPQPAAAAKSAGCISSTTSAPPAEKIELPGVPNFGKVSATLYRGGQPSKDGFAELKNLGVQIVVNLRDDNFETERSEVTAVGLEYVAIPWNCHHPANSLVTQFLEVLRENPEKRIFVHCHAGVDRTGLMIATHRMAEQGWTPEQAQDEMKDFGFNFIHRSWCRALVNYEEDFPQQLAADPSFRTFLTAQPAPRSCAP